MANTDMRKRLAMMLESSSVIISGIPPITTRKHNLLSLKTFGGTEQNGTPTPDNPVDIVSNNGVIKYGQYGKNLYDFVTSENLANNGNVRPTKGINELILTGADSLANFSVMSFAKVADLEGKTVTLSYNNPTNNGTIQFVYCDANGTNRKAKTTSTITISSLDAEGRTNIALRVNAPTTDTTEVFRYTNIQIELGSTATPYEPYHFGIHTDGTVETINVHGKNLLNPANIHQGTLNSASGVVIMDGRRCYFDFIKVKAGSVIYASTKNNTPPFHYKLFLYNEANESTFVGSMAGTTFSFGDYSGYKYVVNDDQYVRGLLLQNDAFTPEDVVDAQVVIQNDTPTKYSPYYDGGTATTEMLLKVGNYKDTQEVLTGEVTRNVGVKVFDGTENWWYYSLSQGNMFRTMIVDSVQDDKKVLGVLCNSYEVVLYTQRTNGTLSGTVGYYDFINNNYTTLIDWKQYLADQYNAGTPVIVVYPLAEPTTETVLGQTIAFTSGTNIIDITQASLNNLELEIKAK